LDLAAKEQRYAPGLDGIRGLAVAAITAYHLGLINGGILSVTVFFTLSGYLITSILLGGFTTSGAIDLSTFWARRARRLLPALLLVLAVVMLATVVARPTKLVAHGRQALAALFYFANWATIARGDNYFNRFSGPSPLDHLWSLAIEEQFYAVWPLLLLTLLLIGRRLRSKAPLVVVTALLALASTVAMAIRYVPNAVNNTRAYEGTDTRAAPMLVGALVAMILPLERLRRERGNRLVLEGFGLVSLAVVAAVVAATDELSPFLYRGGEAVVALATAALIISAAHPATTLGRLLGVAPLRWLGERTYGVYLWHLPVVAFMPPTLFPGRPVARVLFQVALIVTLAALSWSLLEDPIRRGRVSAQRWAGAFALVPVAAVALIAPIKLSPAAPLLDLDVLEAESKQPAPEPSPSASPVLPAKDAPLTACRELVHVGDSTSLGLISKSYVPNPEERLEARYRAVGVQLFVPEISGGRSVVEKMNDHASAYEVVAWKQATGFKGCYVFAIGIGDSATTLGNVPGLSKRIDWMMARAGGAPVLWATNKTLLKSGPYRNAFMEGWNRALREACARYPNMRVYDWAREVRDEWYLADAIHPNGVGSVERAARFARALAAAFPRDRAPAAECVLN